ncbi:MAG TPA: hypothetical protein VFW09_06925, partial [Solirubrobacteraceae bacterium]|nr:hypothetical protein [Solirubrobacteraceae bacterium]
MSLGAAGVRIELVLHERPGIECVCRSGEGYVWTRKQGGIAACGTVTLPGSAPIAVDAAAVVDDGGVVDAAAVVDDTAGYHERHTRWRWSAGVG